jgi:hypothetical protein
LQVHTRPLNRAWTCFFAARLVSLGLRSGFILRGSLRCRGLRHGGCLRRFLALDEFFVARYN